MTRDGLRVAVVGGSIGGLTAALLLLDGGCDVQVYERAPVALDGLGAGIIVQEESVRYFVERTDISLDRISLTSSTVRYLNRDGSTLHERESVYRFTAWDSLFRGLASVFPADRYHRGEALVGLQQDADGVDLRFASGLAGRFDLVVCADGVNSVGRKRLFGVTAAYSGYVGWRGILDPSELTPATWRALQDTFTYQVLKDSHVVAYPIPMIGDTIEVIGQRVNYTWYRNVPEGCDYDELMTDASGMFRGISVPVGAVQERPARELRALAEDVLAPPLAELVVRTRRPFITAIVDADTPSLAAGRVCLVGDSAVTARPHAAAGSAKACDDAWTMAEAVLRAGHDVAGALAEWQSGQVLVGRALLERTRDMGRRLQHGGPWDPADPTNRFGLKVPVVPR
jgi:2,6-dihydroxypyridine 3-monooxygenase